MYGEVRRAGRRWSGDTASSGEASGDTTSLGEGSGDTASSGQGRYRELLRASWGEREVSDRQNLAPNVSPYTTTYSCMETRPWSCTETCPRCLRGVSVHDDYGRVSVHDYRYGPASVHYTEVSPGHVSVHYYGRVSVHDYRYRPVSVHYTDVSRTCLCMHTTTRTCL